LAARDHNPHDAGGSCLGAGSASAGFWRKLFAFMGPGLMVAVGYMDPGNWATDLAAERGLDTRCYR